MEVYAYANKNVTQPYLCLSGSIEEGGTYFLVLDQKAILVGEHITIAFETLFKTFYVFNLEYDKSLIKFYNFFECIYTIDSKLKIPKVLELIREISS